MDSSILGLVVDSSTLIAVERSGVALSEAIEGIRAGAGTAPIAISAWTIAELAHGIYRANTPERRQRRRRFVDELKVLAPVHPITGATAEIIARVGGEQAAQGRNIPLADLIIGACALELGYAVGTSNVRDFIRIPGLTVVHL